MSLSLGTAVIELAVNSAKFTSELQKAHKQFTGFAGSVQAASRGAMQALNGMGGALSAVASMRTAIVAVAGTGGIGLLINKSLELGDSIAKASTRLGIGAEALQEIQHAAHLSGLSMEQLDTGLQRLNRRLGEAAGGNGEAIRLFKDLGINVTTTGGGIRATEDVLADFAEKIRAVESPAERTRLAVAAFGRSGAELIPLLEGGREGLQRMAAEARRFGLVLDAEIVKRAERAKDELELLGRVISVNLAAAIGQFVASDQFAGWVRSVSAGLVAVTKRFKDFGIIKLTPADEIARLRAEIERLEKSATKIEGGESLGDRLNKFFGQGTNDRERIAKLKTELEALLEGQSLAFRPPRGVTAPIGPTAEQLNALEAFRGKLIDLAVADPVAQAMLNVRREVEKLKETAPGLAGDFDKIGAAMEKLFVQGFDVKSHEAGVEKLRQELDRDIKDWQTFEADMFATPSDLLIEQTRGEIRQASADFAEFERQLNENIKAWDGFEAGMVATSGEIINATHGVRNGITAVTEGVQEAFDAIDRQRAAFGSLFDDLPPKIAVVNDAILQLLAEGLDPFDSRIRELRNQLDGLKAQADTFKLLETLGTTAASRIGDSLADLATTGKANFADFATSLVRDMTRIIIQGLITKAVISVLGFATNGATGAFNLSGSLASFRAATNNFGSGFGVGADVGGIGASPYAEGGIITKPTVALMGEHGKEAVIPLERIGDYISPIGNGTPAVEININVEPGMEVERRQRTGANGKEIYDFIIRTVNSGFANGAFNRNLKGFGVTPLPTGR